MCSEVGDHGSEAVPENDERDGWVWCVGPLGDHKINGFCNGIVKAAKVPAHTFTLTVAMKIAGVHMDATGCAVQCEILVASAMLMSAVK